MVLKLGHKMEQTYVVAIAVILMLGIKAKKDWPHT